MANCEGCEKPAKDFIQMRADIERAERASLLADVPAAMLVAVGIKESHGRKYFSEKDDLYRENIHVLVHQGKMTKEHFLGLIVDKDGPARGLIPKFRYEPSWRAKANKMTALHQMPAIWEVLLSCSFGYFQKGMCWHMSAKKPVEWASALRLMFHSSNEQCKVAANDLRVLVKNSNGDIPLAFTRYNAGPGAHAVTDYGEKVWALYRHEVGL